MKRVIIVGGGTMGLACAWALSIRGISVHVVERFQHVHRFGSHGGHTRVIRRAYFEGSAYVPLVNRAMELWQGLGDELVVDCGVIVGGQPDDPEMLAAIAATETSGVSFQILPAEDIRTRWPLAFPDEWIGVWSPSDGYLRVDACLSALRDAAQSAGATFEYGQRVTVVDGAGVTLEDGRRLRGDAVVVAAGAYVWQLAADAVGDRIRAQRRILTWTHPDEQYRESLASMPVWAAFTDEGLYYGFPWRDEGTDAFKLALHPIAADDRLADPVDPETVDRDIHPEDLAPLDRFLERYLPAGRGPHVTSQVCLYGTTPTGDFLIDRHPHAENVVLVAGFSGHGFKFAPAVGEHVAGLLLDGAAPLKAFSLPALVGAQS